MLLTNVSERVVVVNLNLDQYIFQYISNIRKKVLNINIHVNFNSMWSCKYMSWVNSYQVFKCLLIDLFYVLISNSHALWVCRCCFLPYWTSQICTRKFVPKFFMKVPYTKMWSTTSRSSCIIGRKSYGLNSIQRSWTLCYHIKVNLQKNRDNWEE